MFCIHLLFSSHFYSSSPSLSAPAKQKIRNDNFSLCDDNEASNSDNINNNNQTSNNTNDTNNNSDSNENNEIQREESEEQTSEKISSETSIYIMQRGTKEI